MFTFTVDAIMSERCTINGALNVPTVTNSKGFIYIISSKLFKSQGIWTLTPEITPHDVIIPARLHSLKRGRK